MDRYGGGRMQSGSVYVLNVTSHSRERISVPRDGIHRPRTHYPGAVSALICTHRRSRAMIRYLNTLLIYCPFTASAMLDSRNITAPFSLISNNRARPMSNATQPMLTPEQQAQAFQELLRTLGDSDIVHKNAVASAVWVGFDILMSMGDEINRMWGARMLSAPTLTYFVTRYFSFAYLVYNATIVLSKDLSPTMCSRWGIMLAASVQLMSLFVNGLLAVRVNAFFSGDRRVKWIVGLFWIAETVVELVLSTISGAESAEPQPFPAEIPSSGCLPAGGATPRMTIAAWVTNIVYSVLCFSLITYRFLSVYLRRNLTNELAQTFLRDGAMLFFMVCGANIVNLILLYALPKSLITLAGVPWLVAAFSIASYRTILDLRGAHRKGSGFSSEFEMSQRQSSTPMAFANGPGVRHRRRRGKDILDIDYESTGIALQTFQASSDASQTLRGSEDAY